MPCPLAPKLLTWIDFVSIPPFIISLSQLPLSLLKTAQGHPMLVELKNGDTYNGRLVSCDTWMNITLRDVICTSRVRSIIFLFYSIFVCLTWGAWNNTHHVYIIPRMEIDSGESQNVMSVVIVSNIWEYQKKWLIWSMRKIWRKRVSRSSVLSSYHRRSLIHSLCC